MGIHGLLILLKPLIKDIHISTLDGKTAAIDAMSWLYRGCYACALEIYTKKDTVAYLAFIYKMLKMLERWNIKPIFVFDGIDLPAKERTLALRKSSKKTTKAKAFALLNDGNIDEARKMFSKCLKIKSYMIYCLIDLLKSMNIDYIMAPYEADAQIAFLCKNKIADFAITEDSDLLCYNCPETVFKLTATGECQYLCLEEYRIKKRKKEKLPNESLDTLLSLSPQDFTFICIMAGCDYLPSIKGIGIKKAINYFHRFVKFERVIGRLQCESAFRDKIPVNYEEIVKHISLIFEYQLVFYPNVKDIVPLNFAEDQASIVRNYAEFIGTKFENFLEFVKGNLDKHFKQREATNTNLKQIFSIKPKSFTSQIDIDTQVVHKTLSDIKNSHKKDKEILKTYPKNSMSKKSFEMMPDEAEYLINDYIVNEPFFDKSLSPPKEEFKINLAKDNPEHQEEIGENHQNDFLFEICRELTKGFDQIKDIIRPNNRDQIQPRENEKKSVERITKSINFLNPFAEKKDDHVFDSMEQLKSKSPIIKKSNISVQKSSINIKSTILFKEENLNTPDSASILKRKNPEPLINCENEVKQNLEDKFQRKKSELDSIKKTKLNNEIIKQTSQSKISAFFTKNSNTTV